MPSVQQEEGHALLKSTHIRPAALLLSISKSNWFYFKSDQCSFDRLNSLFQKPYCNPYSRLYPRKVRVHRVIDRPLKALGQNQKNQYWTIIRKSVNVEILCSSFLRGQPLKIPRGILHTKHREMQTFETIRIFLQFLYGAKITTFVYMFVFSECFQIIQWRVLDQMHLQLKDTTRYQCRFSMYCNKGKGFFPFLFSLDFIM